MNNVLCYFILLSLLTANIDNNSQDNQKLLQPIHLRAINEWWIHVYVSSGY